jgi:hypothetical protein
MTKQNDLLLKAITQVMIEAFCDEEGWSDYLEELLMVYKKHSPELYEKIINSRDC